MLGLLDLSFSLRGDPSPLPVRRRGARGRHGGPDPSTPGGIPRTGHRNRPSAPPFAHRPLATQGRDPRPRATFKALAGIMVALLFVVVASALQRMYLYQQEFGLTGATSLHDNTYGLDLHVVSLVRPHRATRQAPSLRVRGPYRRFRRHLRHKHHEPRCPDSKHQHRPHGRWQALRRLPATLSAPCPCSSSLYPR